MTQVATALAIGGSDSSGKAGVQADLRAFGAVGVHGATCITAVTAQGQAGVCALEVVSRQLVRAQLQTAAELRLGAMKTGMIPSLACLEEIVEFARCERQTPLVCDPVLFASSGEELTPSEVSRALVHDLLPLCALVTPNRFEAQELCHLDVVDAISAKRAGDVLLKAGAAAVLFKGGHGDGPAAVDFFVCPMHVIAFASERVETRHSRGTGCTLASCIAAALAKGLEMPHAVRYAKQIVAAGLEAAVAVGPGDGPVAVGAVQLTSKREIGIVELAR